MKQSDINKGRIRMWFGPLFFWYIFIAQRFILSITHFIYLKILSDSHP